MDSNVGGRPYEETSTAASVPVVERVGLMIDRVQQMSLDGDLFENWSKWLDEFDAYMSAYDYVRLPESRKVAILLYSIGKPAQEIFNTFRVSSRNITVDWLKQRFSDHFAVHSTKMAAKRITFFSRRQLAGENVGRYLNDLVINSLSCDFGNLRENIVKTKFISGLNPDNMHLEKRLLTDHKLKVCHLQALFPPEPVSEDNQDASGLTQPSACRSKIKFKSRSGRLIKKPKHFDL